MSVLRVDDLVVRYGAATALDGVSLSVEAGEMVALIGPNGAGKSTLVNTLSGIVRPARGNVHVGGRLAHVPEGREMFADLTVDDNLRLGGWRNGRRGRDTGHVYEVFPELVPLRRQRAGRLSGGQQQMVAVGRALMAQPDVLAVDELSLGLAPLVVAGLVRHLRALNRERGLAVLLIEQNARLALGLAGSGPRSAATRPDAAGHPAPTASEASQTSTALGLCSRAYVLEAGRVVAEGPAAQLAADSRLTAAYLGGPVEAAR